ncbi:DUF4097 family beta strand repeat-containing protein [Amycolatopsis suaedae]|uniref:DUF4097 domain-containing protein n=1 Tax=Amycolatopsis suaedae TaxID=2510978 RepID=A0A4Q7JBI1_9PSEU|nr:DUF4097 family beta strand repeat-containing protein [Amycolatopsis suaedae]RZQ65181.1 hypothetical protein EWH70_04635 [Amycolatopsis suaedae]
MKATYRRLLGGVLLAVTGALALAGCQSISVGGETLNDGEPINEQVSKVQLDVPAGTVKIRVEDNAPLSLRREVRFHDQRPGKTHRVEGSTLVLAGCGDECSVNYDVVLPKPLEVTGKASAGDVELTRVGAVDVRASAGRVAALDVTGPVKVDAAAGDVNVRLARPDNVTVRASAGNVEVTVPKARYNTKLDASAGKTYNDTVLDPAAPTTIDLKSSAGDLSVRTAA